MRRDSLYIKHSIKTVLVTDEVLEFGTWHRLRRREMSPYEVKVCNVMSGHLKNFDKWIRDKGYRMILVYLGKQYLLICNE